MASNESNITDHETASNEANNTGHDDNNTGHGDNNSAPLPNPAGFNYTLSTTTRIVTPTQDNPYLAPFMLHLRRVPMYTCQCACAEADNSHLVSIENVKRASDGSGRLVCGGCLDRSRVDMGECH